MRTIHQVYKFYFSIFLPGEAFVYQQFASNCPKKLHK